MDPVQVNRFDDICVIILNRPESKNAINKAMAVGLGRAFDLLDSSPEFRVGVLVGTGPDFCAGMDLKAFARGEIPEAEGRPGGVSGLTRQATTKPLIAAVEGHAVAGGCELVLACDIVVASRSARFGLPEVKRGLVAAGGGALRLPRRLPFHVAMHLLLTGDFIEADDAYRYGLASVLVDTGDALNAALALAKEVASNAPLAVTTTKQLALAALDWPVEEAFDRQAQQVQAIIESSDAREGSLAFTQKRPPRWQGR